jgi:hypothetical protein
MMDIEQKIRVAGLAALAFDAQRKVDALGMMNVPDDYNKSKAQSVKYALAVAEANKLSVLLREAQA